MDAAEETREDEDPARSGVVIRASLDRVEARPNSPLQLDVLRAPKDRTAALRASGRSGAYIFRSALVRARAHSGVAGGRGGKGLVRHVLELAGRRKVLKSHAGYDATAAISRKLCCAGWRGAFCD